VDTFIRLLSVVLLVFLVAAVVCFRKSFREDKFFLALAALFLTLAGLFGILLLIFVNLRS